MLILISDAFDKSLPDKLRVFGEVTDDTSRLKEADVVLIRSKTKATKEYIDEAANMKPGTVERRAKELANNPKVSARLDYLKEHAAEAANISLQRIIKEHARIAFSDATRVRSGWYTLKEFNELTEDERACIKSVETKQRKVLNEAGQTVVEEWVKVQVYDKQKALDALCNILGYNSPQKLEGDFRLSGVKVEVIDQDAAALLQEVMKR